MLPSRLAEEIDNSFDFTTQLGEQIHGATVIASASTSAAVCAADKVIRSLKSQKLSKCTQQFITLKTMNEYKVEINTIKSN